jgi:hypothetical protein
MDMKFEIKSRWDFSKVLFEAEIECSADAPYSVKLGLAVKVAVGKGASLSDAYLRDAYLSCADLRDANLRGANLSCADLRDANLRGASLSGADLRGANLRDANLRDANLRGADLCGADLCGANLCGANLRDANLRDADLRDANLRDANLRGAKNSALILVRTIIVPEGDLIGWKKCQGGVIVKLKIPAKARRSNATGRKCRAEYVKVLEVIGADFGISSHDGKTEYRAGKTVTCDEWCENRFEECAGGIHFFITREEAEAY